MAKQRGRYFWQTVESRLQAGDSITQVAKTLSSTFQEIWRHFKGNPQFPRKYRFLIWLAREDDADAAARLNDIWPKVRATYTTKEGHSRETPTTLAMSFGVKASLITRRLRSENLMDNLDEKMAKNTGKAFLRGSAVGAGLGAGIGALKTLLKNRKIRKTKGKGHPKKSYVKGVLGGAAIGGAIGGGYGVVSNAASRRVKLSATKFKRHAKNVERQIDKSVAASSCTPILSRYWKDRKKEGFMPGVRIIKNLSPKKESIKESIQGRAARVRILRNARS